MLVSDLSGLLSTTSTVSERVKGLHEVGLSYADIADAIGVNSGNTLRNWTSGSSEPKRDSGIALDDLRTVVKVLLDADIEPTRVVSWLKSRDPDFENGERPIDIVYRSPMDVISQALWFVEASRQH